MGGEQGGEGRSAGLKIRPSVRIPMDQGIPDLHSHKNEMLWPCQAVPTTDCGVGVFLARFRGWKTFRVGGQVGVYIGGRTDCVVCAWRAGPAASAG